MPDPLLISHRAITLQPSLTLAISAKAKALKQQGKDICSLSAGEPDFDTPDFIVEAAVKALRDGITRYGPSAGDPELREAIALKLREVNKISVDFKNVLVTNGGKQAIFNLFQVILNPGDEVLIPVPYWLSYPEMTRFMGAVPVFLPSSPMEDFKIDLQILESSITPKTKLLILNSPGNPTGRVISLKELQSVAEILRKHPHVFVMSDEIYEFLLSNNQTHHSFANVAPDLIDRVFTVNGFAKAWAMTGWRVGYLCGNLDVINAASSLQSQSTSNVCSFAQRGALAALTSPMKPVLEMVNTYNKRRTMLTKGLNNIQGIYLSSPEGAFYAFPKLLDSSISSIEFCNLALEKEGLAIVPGIAFGDDQCIRLSCAVSEPTIQDGLARLDKLVTN